jgi:hypothetical protein
MLIADAACAQKTSSNLTIDSLPESQIDIPIQINLRPVYALAEKQVDTVFTSPNYPTGWIQEGCDTRYKYHFRRTPLKISGKGTTLSLGFTGLYKITGSTRVCVRGTVLSPWTPECNCGFSEGERKVQIGFTSTFNLRPDYMLQTKIVRAEPQALDKCEVCFWGQDITKVVIGGLKQELDASRKTMEASFGNINLRPYMQQAWNMLSDVYTLPNVGYFSLNPKKLRMQNINAQNDLLNISIGISATPVVSFARPGGAVTTVPNLSAANNPGGFNIYLEAALQYDSLSGVMNGYLRDKRFNLSEGLIKKHIIVKEAGVSGDEGGNMRIRLLFEGSHKGTIYFRGKPSYNPETKTIEVKDLDYDLETKDFLLKTARWLFNKKIISELKKYTVFDLSSYYNTATTTINSWLNREWTKGIRGAGSVRDLTLTNVYALPQHLLIRSNCTGQLSVSITEIDLKF